MAFGLVSSCLGDTVKMTIPAGNFTRKIGNGSLDDPTGASHSQQDIAGKVVVAIFSAPTMSQGDAQERWSDLLADEPASKLPTSIFLALVEDMSQAGIFKGMALDDMKKQFTKGTRPLVVLDQTGAFFKAFGVPRGKTQILIYDKTSTLRDVEQDLSNQTVTVQRIQAITKQLQAK